MNGHQHRMLLVEDHPPTRNLMRRILTLCGWQVVEAASIAEGMAGLGLDPPPECVLLDLDLPDGDGGAILRKVRQDKLPMRVIVNTGVEDPDRLDALAALRPDCLLQKPLDAEGLRTISAPPQAM